MISEAPLKKMIYDAWKKDGCFVVTQNGNIKSNKMENLSQIDVISSLIIDSKPHDNIKDFEEAIAEAIDGLMCLKYQTNEKINICEQIYNMLHS